LDEAERKLCEHREHVADRQLFVTVACFTGVELAALFRLDWSDVDFIAGRIRVPGTKNATRDRTIDLDPQLKLALLRPPGAEEQERGDGSAPPVSGCLSVGNHRAHGRGAVCRRCAKPGGDPWRVWRSWRAGVDHEPKRENGRFRGETAVFDEPNDCDG
jgi:integrase